ncbi:hypothetical protein, partial [Collinsella aerofaciens]|uniref:hypothetical protein n=1 Tax=Collinsella aerofaciens TaxID=74426 RepID=UPI001C10E4F5
RGGIGYQPYSRFQDAGPTHFGSGATPTFSTLPDITLCGMEVWGNLTLRGAGTLTATGSQCGIHVSQALVMDGCTVDARADGADITDEAVAGVIAGDMAVRGGGRVVAAGAGVSAGII